MSSNRNAPYNTTNKSIGEYLKYNLFIPMNQREYSWTKKEIIPVLNDIKELFKETEFKELMGSIIIYQNPLTGMKDVYDGQQRTITIILTLLVIGEISKTVGNGNDGLYKSIIQMLSVDTLMDTPTRYHTAIKSKEIFKDVENLIIPRIYCVNPNDNDALVEIFNNLTFNHWKYVKNIDKHMTNNVETGVINEDSQSENDASDNEIEDDSLKYICSICDESIARKKDFLRHLKNQHDQYKTKNPNYSKSKVYDAYLEIYNTILCYNYDWNNLRGLLQFITKDIDIQLYESSDGTYVSRIFEWQNNRGKELAKLDLVKNLLLTGLSDDKKVEFFDKWDGYKKIENKIISDYGQRLLDCAIQIYNNKFERIIDDKTYKSIIDNGIKHGNLYEEIIKFLDIVRKLNDIYDDIKKHRFGRLITNTKSISWEAYQWCLLPIYYKINSGKTKKMDDKLIKLFVKYYYRNKSVGNIVSCNSFRYSNCFLETINTFYLDNTVDYYSKIERNLQSLVHDNIKKENYIRTLEQTVFTYTKFTTYLLYFLETCETTDANLVNMELTLEHIYPQKNKDKLSDSKLINYIGNLTLLENKNSENGHKGNSSLGAKDYKIKKESYARSHSSITRNIPIKFNSDTFLDEQIIQRTKELAIKIEKYTNYL